jgi:hypothetical protein
MATDNQTAANRANSKKSTGPITPAGKTSSSLNAVRHGFYAKTAILPGEDPKVFEKICDGLEAEWQPQTTTENYQVEQMAVSYWTQIRLGSVRLQLLEKNLDLPVLLPLLDRLDQHLGRLQRSHSRALKELRSLQKARLQQAHLDDARDGGGDNDPNRCEGLAWIDNDGNVDVRVPPAVRGPDGKWHDLPRSEWTLNGKQV